MLVASEALLVASGSLASALRDSELPVQEVFLASALSQPLQLLSVDALQVDCQPADVM